MRTPILNTIYLDQRPSSAMGKRIAFKRKENMVVNRSISPLNHSKINQITEFINNMRDYIGRSENFVIDYLPKKKKEQAQEFDFLEEQDKYISTHFENAYENSSRMVKEMAQEQQAREASDQSTRKKSQAKLRQHQQARQTAKQALLRRQEEFLNKLMIKMETTVKDILECRRISTKRKKEVIDLKLISSEALLTTKDYKLHTEHIREWLRNQLPTVEKVFEEDEDMNQSLLDSDTSIKEKKKNDKSKHFMFSDWDNLKKKWSLSSD
jgi:hypothetical protein